VPLDTGTDPGPAVGDVIRRVAAVERLVRPVAFGGSTDVYWPAVPLDSPTDT